MGVIQSTITRVQRRNKIAVMRKTISTGKSDVITEIMMPVYYTSEAVSKTNISIIKESWYEIVNSTGEEFQSKKGQIPYSKCLEWFEKLFTERLFDVHPMSKMLFHDDETAGVVLGRFFSSVFEYFEDDKRFYAAISKLVDKHNKRGVKAIEYSIVGDVLFWTLKIVLGHSYTTIAASWILVYSRILRVVIPLFIAAELKSNNSQVARNKQLRKDPQAITFLIDSENKFSDTKLSSIYPVNDEKESQVKMRKRPSLTIDTKNLKY